MRNITDAPDLEGWPVSSISCQIKFELTMEQRRYAELGHVIRRFKHLMMLKRAGRGHDPDGVAATQNGQLAIDCPACPLPGKNLPDDWLARSVSKP